MRRRCGSDTCTHRAAFPKTRLVSAGSAIETRGFGGPSRAGTRARSPRRRRCGSDPPPIFFPFTLLNIARAHAGRRSRALSFFLRRPREEKKRVESWTAGEFEDRTSSLSLSSGGVKTSRRNVERTRRKSWRLLSPRPPRRARRSRPFTIPSRFVRARSRSRSDSSAACRLSRPSPRPARISKRRRETGRKAFRRLATAEHDRRGLAVFSSYENFARLNTRALRYASNLYGFFDCIGRSGAVPSGFTSREVYRAARRLTWWRDCRKKTLTFRAAATSQPLQHCDYRRLSNPNFIGPRGSLRQLRSARAG